MARHEVADPIARLIRERRTQRGMSLQALAAAAVERMPRRGRGRRPTLSPAYLSLIESGRKVPNAPVALAIAAALGEDEALFRAWIVVRKKADLDAALDAAETLRAYRASSGDARTAAPGTGSADAPLVVPHAPAARDPARPRTLPAFTRLRVPVIAEGDDPGDGVRPSCPILEWRALHTGSLSAATLSRLDRPFAIRLGAAAATVGLSPGEHVIVLRDLVALAPESVCAVRTDGRVTLRRVVWDGRAALVLPLPGEHDFEVADAPDRGSLATRVLGLARRIEFGG